MLRIIAGKYRGRKLKQPPIGITRATPDRVREAIFSMIHDKIKSKIFLDLFAGSGAFSVEAVSRGAMKAIAVEKNPQAYKVIRNNIETLKIDNIDARQMDALLFIAMNAGNKYDFIFVDPQYSIPNIHSQVLEAIVESEILSSLGYIFVESHFRQKIFFPKSLVCVKVKNYGQIKISVLANNI